jgi:glycosyltransferase involved in cell wall biosynthesis
MSSDAETVRLVRIIARLNVGGPSIQAITLTRRLEPRGYRTRLVRGREAPSEGNMDHLASELGVVPTLVPSMRRDPGVGDIAALRRLIAIMRADRPQIVHTHAAKAGTLGRLAVLLACGRSRPVIVHTFHGHSLTGYFSGRTARFYRVVERWLARRTDVLVAVSAEVRDELAGLGVAPPERFVVVPVGFDLARFADDAGRSRRRTGLRTQWGIVPDAEVVTLVARLVAVKRVDRFLEVAQLLADRPRARFVVVGDGDLRDQLTASDQARALGERVVWAGFRRDMADVLFASDVVMLTSDHEGTPVSLIEAQAAAVPVVGTDVGGTRSAVRDGETGLLAAAGDVPGLAGNVAALLDDRELAARMSAAGRRHVLARYTLERLVDDHDRLYRSLLERRKRDRGSAPAVATDVDRP